MAKIVTLTKGGIEKLIKAAGTVSPTSQKLAQMVTVASPLTSLVSLWIV